MNLDSYLRICMRLVMLLSQRLRRQLLLLSKDSEIAHRGFQSSLADAESAKARQREKFEQVQGVLLHAPWYASPAALLTQNTPARRPLRPTPPSTGN